MPTQDCPFCHTTAYLVAPLSSRDLMVNLVSPGLLYLSLYLHHLLVLLDRLRI